MRKDFTSWLEAAGARRSDLVLLTGDLGYTVLEKVSESLGPRFVNVGVCEQHMISLAAGMAQQGMLVFCYSIAPFVVYRPVEQIRIDVCLHRLNVKIVGNGGGYGYGIMGPTHHAIEDLAVLSALPHMKCYVPFCNEDVAGACEAMLAWNGPSYLRLGYAAIPDGVGRSTLAYGPVCRIRSGTEVTVVGIGPVVWNAFHAAEKRSISADVFAVRELPLDALDPQIAESVQRTQKLLVVEEHVRRGGLGEQIGWLLTRERIRTAFAHRHAVGYPDGLYGSQAYHQRRSGLDESSLSELLGEMSHG